jgi:NAD(P)-dependent dehydrogenase (short-subunit alcohol dehydrogenase family)
MEFVKTGLRVNAIAPAGVNTPLARNFAVPEEIDFTLMQPYIGFRPPAEADDVAAMFAHLVSDECRSVNGAVVTMDSGITAG